MDKVAWVQGAWWTPWAVFSFAFLPSRVSSEDSGPGGSGSRGARLPSSKWEQGQKSIDG